MSALNSLARVHTWVLNEKRQKLAGLEQLVERMRADLQQLENDLVREQQAATDSLEGTIAFPAFIAAALERRRRLRQSIADLDRAIETAREEVHAAFLEVKKYELARDIQERKEEAERGRRERAVLDELGVNRYERNRRAEES